MNNEEKTKIEIDINNLDLTPVIDDKSINDGSSNEKKEVKLFPDITDNVSVKDNSSLLNDMDKLVEKGGVNLFPNVETDVNRLENVQEKEIDYLTERKSNLVSILLFIVSILQFIVIPFIFRTTNFSEGEYSAYPYPNLKYLLCIGFVLFSCFIYYSYRNKELNKNSKKIFLKIILLVLLLILFIFNDVLAIVIIVIFLLFLLGYIFVFIYVNVENKTEEILSEYIVALFVTGFLAMIGGPIMWVLFIPPLLFLYPIFIVSAILAKMSILCGILFVIVCGISIYLIIKNDSDE